LAVNIEVNLKMDALAKIVVTYDSKKVEDNNELVDVVTQETVVVKCHIPTSATCDEEIYYHLLKKVIPNLTSDTERIWAIDIISNVPEKCKDVGLNIYREEATFFFEQPHDDVFVKYLAHQLGISSKVGSFDPAHICEGCMNHLVEDDPLEEPIIHYDASQAIH
jgi:hypothetical protein|tara:strand:- start:239 stop:730 length:492 start_codon:yes stop_codon:yes gene_type:complete